MLEDYFNHFYYYCVILSKGLKQVMALVVISYYRIHLPG